MIKNTDINYNEELKKWKLDRTNSFEWTNRQLIDQLTQFKGNLTTMEKRLETAKADKAKLIRIRDNKCTIKDIFEIITSKDIKSEIAKVDQGIEQISKAIPEFKEEIEIIKPSADKAKLIAEKETE